MKKRFIRRVARKAYGGGGLTQLVRRIANRGREVKHVGQTVVNAAFNQQITTDVYTVMPDVTEGTDGHQRIGDRVRPKYLLIKGKLMYDLSMQGSYIPPATVRLLILSQKNVKTSLQIRNNEIDTAHLLKDNIGTDVGRAYVGGPFDNLAPINKDLFTVHMDRKVKMRAQIEKEVGNNNTVLGYATQRTVTFTCKIKCPASLTFDDGNLNTPNNFAPFFCVGGVNDDDSAAFTVSTPYRVVVQSELYFVDP